MKARSFLRAICTRHEICSIMTAERVREREVLNHTYVHMCMCVCVPGDWLHRAREGKRKGGSRRLGIRFECIAGAVEKALAYIYVYYHYFYHFHYYYWCNLLLLWAHSSSCSSHGANLKMQRSKKCAKKSCLVFRTGLHRSWAASPALFLLLLLLLGQLAAFTVTVAKVKHAHKRN